MSVVRLALVGCGSIAKVHLQSCRACGGVVTALVDVRRKAATELLELLPPGEAEECKVSIQQQKKNAKTANVCSMLCGNFPGLEQNISYCTQAYFFAQHFLLFLHDNIFFSM